MADAGTARRRVLAARYREVRAATEELAAPLSPEDQTVQSMPDASPTKWHRGHTSWFFETFLLQGQPRYSPYDPAFAYIFNSYYEAVGPRYPRPERGILSRPGVAEVAAYRHHVDSAMGELLEGELDEATADLVELGLHHEQQHQELLLMDIKHALSRNPLLPAYRPGAGAHPSEARKLGWLEHEGGLAEIGHRPGTGFAFDNELPCHLEHLTPFALADRPVTCGEWLGFMEDGGYSRPELWLSDGWAAVAQGGMDVPPVLVPGDDERAGVQLVRLHPGRPAACRPGRAGVPHQLLRGRRVRPLGRVPAPDRGRVGGGRQGIVAGLGELARPAGAPPAADRRLGDRPLR